MATTTLHGLIW